MHEADGIERIGPVKWDLALCLLGVFLLVYFSLWKGVKSTGKVKGTTSLAVYSSEWGRIISILYQINFDLILPIFSGGVVHGHSAVHCTVHTVLPRHHPARGDGRDPILLDARFREAEGDEGETTALNDFEAKKKK